MKVSLIVAKAQNEAIGKDNNVFLQVSNIWQYETNYLNTPHHQAQAAFINLINELFLKKFIIQNIVNIRMQLAM